MSRCTKWVDRLVLKCKNWGDKADYECTEWADEGSHECDRWADEGSHKCDRWADEGSYRCDRWADEGSRKCAKWGKKCKWYTFWNCIIKWFCKAYYWVAKWVCKAWYWVAKWVCKAWYWVAKWVCKAWYWVAKWVCKAFAWVVKTVCLFFSWAVIAVCVAWDTAKCGVNSLIRFVTGRPKVRKDGPKIEHVFLLVLENQSFDRLLGLSDITGTDAITGEDTALRGVDRRVHFNTNPQTNTDIFVREGADLFLKGKDYDPGHEFENIITQLCGKNEDGSHKSYPDPVTGGYPPINNSGFVADFVDVDQNKRAEGDGLPSHDPERMMQCHSPDELPVLNALAREFAVCDNWFSSMPGPTWPNRFFIHAASSAGLDDSPSVLDIVSGTTVDGFRFENGTIFDALDDKCIDWQIYEGDEFPVSYALRGMGYNALVRNKFSDFDEFKEDINELGFDKKFVFIEPKYGKHEFNPFGPGDFACGNSMHPLDDITRGERLIKEVYEAIRNSPHWESSVLVITMDEHGGFYDHVHPPRATPPGDLVRTGHSHHDFAFDQLGVRVPTIIVSPLIRKGVIDHTEYDHASFLATLERLMGLSPLTNRDKNANDFLHLFSLDNARDDTPENLPREAESGFECEDDVDALSAEGLIYRRSELIAAKKQGLYQERPERQITVAHTQVGFNYVALLKILQTARYPERERWIEEFSNIESGIDAAIFMTEAKLKLNHAMDFKRIKIDADRKVKLAAIRKRPVDTAEDEEDV